MKKLMIIFACIAVLGAIITLIAVSFGGDFDRMNTKEVTHKIDGDFNEIEVRAGSSDIVFKVSESGEAYAVCDESDKITYTVSVKDGKLTVSQNDSRKWYDVIGIWFGGMSVSVYLPEGNYSELNVSSASGSISCTSEELTFGDVTLVSSSGSIKFSAGVMGEAVCEASSGRIEVSGGTPDKLTAETSSGSIKIEKIKECSEIIVGASSGSVKISECTPESLEVSTSSGSIKLDSVVASYDITLESSSGGIRLENCDSEEINIETSSGSVRATLLTDKMFEVRTGSGNTDYPSSIKDSGKCTVKTSSGNVNIKIAE